LISARSGATFGLNRWRRPPDETRDAKAKKLTVSFMSKDQIVAAVRQIVHTPPALLKKLKAALGY
jgi:hypothetical protein